MFMSKKNSAHQQDIDDLKKQNQVLDQEGALSIVAIYVVGPAYNETISFDESHWQQCCRVRLQRAVSSASS